jgi:hypothetical protein
LADGVKIRTSRTKEGAESIVGRRHGADAKVTSGSAPVWWSNRRRCRSQNRR